MTALSLKQIIVLESVLSYIATEKVRLLLRYLQHELTTCLVIIYDPLLNLSMSSTAKFFQSNNVSHAMESTFCLRNVPILFSCRSTSAMRKYLLDCHFDGALSMTMHQVLHHCIKDRDVATAACQGVNVTSHSEKLYLPTNDPFDEFATLSVLHKIYSMSSCSNCKVLFDEFVKNLAVGDIRKHETSRERQKRPDFFDVRNATAQDAIDIAHIFNDCHEEYTKKYSSVRSYIKKNTQLIYDDLNDQVDMKTPPMKAGRCYYIAEDVTTHNGTV